jgi:GntR family transcriptional regulator, transcriptional repressor for pyruvate dehydrogenase complex
MFVYAKSNKVYEHVVEQIRMAISDGSLKPGDKLPSEKELIDKFRVSRGTLREALRSLESTGVLEIRKGVSGGPYITEIGVDRAKENFIDFFRFKKLLLEHLVEVRMMLEPAMAAKVARVITPEDLDRLRESIERCGDTIKTRSMENLRESFLEFHGIIADMTGNPILAFLLDVIKTLPVSGLDPGKQLTRKLAQEILEDHIRIYEALSEGNPEKTGETMTQHILGLGNRLLARSKSRSFRKPSEKTSLPD